MKPFRVIAAHRYVKLSDLTDRQTELSELCERQHLKGYIVLSPEGIDLRVAGEPESIEELLATLKRIPELSDLSPREHTAERSPFRRMAVRVKQELIRLGLKDIDPCKEPTHPLSPRELSAWLDDGKPLTLLDVRNRHEVASGTFANAVSFSLEHFHDLPRAAGSLPQRLRDQPLLVFCTDGLRSRKAAIFLEQQGFAQVCELDGGILRYLQESGSRYFAGACVDIDPRVSSHTEPTVPCARCGTALTISDREHPHYVAGRSCGSCYKPTAEEMAVRLVERKNELRRLTTILPGSVPQDQFRPVNVPADCDGMPLIDVLCRVVTHAPVRFWEDRFRQGLLLDDRDVPCSPDRIVHTGEHFRHRFPDVVEPDVNMDIDLLHEDEAILVVSKPAPLPMHAGGRFHRNTLMFVLDALYAPQKLRPSHRLDANTTGVLVIARTPHAAKKVQTQFARGEVEKRYLVRVNGHPTEDRFECDARISNEASDVGSRFIDQRNGQQAHTIFQVLERFEDATTLIEAQPLTGRTHQIRLHLWHLGFPVRGDSVYLPEGEIGDRQTLEINSLPMCLHAWRLEFKHPLTRERVRFEAPAPSWAGSSG
jgi:UPF0176 protein